MSKLLSTTTLILGLTSTMAFAKINCKEYLDDAQVKINIVESFSQSVRMLEAKVNGLQDKISDRYNMMSSVDVKINAIQASISDLNREKNQLNQSMESGNRQLVSLERDRAQLTTQLTRLERDIANLPASSSVRRQALREAARTRMSIDGISSQIISLNQTLMPISQQVNGITQQISMKRSKLAPLEDEKQSIANIRPTLQSLQQSVQEAQANLQGQDQIQAQNLRALDEAQEKVLMCKTYTVKYPLVLEISKEIYRKGCNKYKVQNFQAEYKAQAEQDALSAICN